ncbi:MAG: GNAT family N-acetyltransferase [Bacteroidota bacterium]
MNITIRKASENDIAIIHQLAEEIWRKYYPEIISDEQIEYMLKQMYSAESLLQQMREGHDFYLAIENNQTIGYYAASEVSPGKYFLHKLYIKNTIHRKGTGQQLFDHLTSKLPTGAELRLTTNRKNFKAINFYFKNGFTIEEVKDFDIGNGFFMNDFVMVRKGIQNSKF